MKILRYFTIVLATLICGSIFAQKSQQELKQIMDERGEYYFSLIVEHTNETQQINDICSVDKTDGTNVVCYANRQQYANILKRGYQPTLLTPPSMLEKVAMWDGTDRDAYEWDSYPTYEAYEAMMYQFGTDHPDKCEITSLGTLPSGRKILIARLHNGTGEGKPKFLYSSTIHGDETTGWILMLRLIDYLLENPNEPEVQAVMDNIDLFIAPLTNPDGTYHAGNGNVNGATRYNANGVDMNRNYPDPNSGMHPDGNPFQAETEWFMQFAQDIPFVMGANYHGGAEVINYPWDNTYTLHADDAWYQLVSREYADLCQTMNPNYMTDLDNGITNGAQWYRIGGGRQDYMNGYAQCRELTIECSHFKLPNSNQLPTFWNYNKEAIFAFMNQCRFGIHGVVSDKTTHQPLNATITIEGHDNAFSVVESHLPAGDYHRPIKGGTYQVTYACNGYHSQTHTLTVADGETLVFDVELEAGEGLVPDFEASATTVTIGSSVDFTDKTWGANLVSWEWTFEGGQPATSNEQNPTGITYNITGDFDVTLSVTNADGQTETITKHSFIKVREAYNMHNGSIETCNALFYDDGGPNGNYTDNKDYTMTFKPGMPNKFIEATFIEFNTENNWDHMYIYDGTSIQATQIGHYTGTNSPGTITATNPEGALTFHFISDQNTNAAGWAAIIRCIGDYEPMIISVSADPMEINEGESTQLEAIVMGGAGNYSWLWEPAETLDDPTICCPIATPVDAETTYKVTVTDADGNTIKGEVTVTISNLSVSENAMLPIIYPNPSKGSFTIDVIGEFTYQLFNSLGQQIMSGKANGKTQIDANGLNQGVYYLHLNGQGSRVEKIVIE